MALLAVVLCSCSKPICANAVHERQPLTAAPVEIAADRPLAVIGDLQGTLVPETVVGRERNAAETDALVCQLGTESQGATAILGDLVTWGSADESWERFDALARRIPGLLLPVRGNHDFFGQNGQAREQWLRRYPWFDQAPWYSVKWNKVGLVFVESNLGELPAAQRAAEQHWYERILDQYEQDPLISGTLVLLHHAPFTGNPNAQGGLEALRKAFVEPFCQRSKVMAMISGHAHGYERYTKPCGKQAVQFIVSGGGGGPRPVNPPCYDDECLGAGCCEPSARPLHYLLIKQQPKGLEITVQSKATKHDAGVVETVRLPFRDDQGVVLVTTTCGQERANPLTECPWQSGE